MELTPEINPGLLNGWVLLVFFYTVFGILLLSFPKSVVARLYDRSAWSMAQKILSAIGKLFIFSWFALVILTPLNIGHAVFIIGGAIYLLGLLGFVLSLLNFKDTPLDQPVTEGLYRISRNPQQVSILLSYLGISIAIGSWVAVLLITVGAFMSHIRVIAEERSCLQQYGDSYRQYIERVPRYFLFF
ncbi:MAG: isoprenylcysteine carboxylmethyltransferase family protein [Anaerolineales bacterium]|nr:MAG: isoprenylcysteine carboxylmethyltransferase family protein [Anaerolineales bacterium]